MFNRDTWQEIWMALKQNKLRTALTGFAISWGIFMLFVLSSFGFGFKQAVMNNFKKDNKNVVTCYGGMTSIPYKGHPTNRFINFKDLDLEIVASNPYVDEISPEVVPETDNGSGAVVFGDKTCSATIDGVDPNYKNFHDLEILSGRFLDKTDMQAGAKVIVISKSMIAKLYKNGQNPIGTYVNIMSTLFQVIGVCKDDNGWGNSAQVYLPYNIVKRLYNVTTYNSITFTTKNIYTVKQSEAFTKHFKQTLARYHEFSQDDNRAVWINSTIEGMQRTHTVLTAIQTFIWLIGIAMLISGITGVSNIMLVTVKERTNEIGIRKALGAKPATILQSIVLESLFITVIFGIIGMILGTVIIAVINTIMNGMPQNEIVSMLHPAVNFGTTFGALLILIIAGVGAGYIPARKAVKVKPIEAIQYR